MSPRRATQLLGWAYTISLGALLLVGTVASDAWGSSEQSVFIGCLFFLLAMGFLASRFFHRESAVFQLLFSFGKLQPQEGTLADKSLVNFFICLILGFLFLVARWL